MHKRKSKHEPEPINEIQRMQKILKDAFPAARIELDEPLRKSGLWALDVFLPGYHLAIVWRAKNGFGLVADEAHGFGEGADEVFPDLDTALPRVIRLVASKRATVPPQAVTLRNIREELGLSQEEIASRLGKKQGGISRQEARSDCHVSTLMEYVNALGCELVMKVIMPDATEREIRFDEAQ